MGRKEILAQFKYAVWICIALLFFFAMGVTACQSEKQEEESETKIDFTVCHEENLPKELKKLIVEKKEKPFKLSYSTKEYTYITVGYGKQMMGGYSIQVQKISVTDSRVLIKTVLKGPKVEEERQGISYPYIVVKIQNMDKPVAFQ